MASTHTFYEGTDFEYVCASDPWTNPDDTEWGLGIIVRVMGREFGVYANLGIVHRGEVDSR